MGRQQVKPPQMLLRKSSERGHTFNGRLNSYHTFSFAEYYDHRYMGFHALRAINEDRLSPGEGLDAHPHKDMEILSYVVSGALAHKDNIGNQRVIKSGGIQKITAGTGIIHSEFNASTDEPVHFIQVWISPRKKGLPAAYEEVDLAGPDRRNPILLIASPDRKEGAVQVHQDVSVHRLCLVAAHTCVWSVRPGRSVWIQVIQGKLEVNGLDLHTGDGLSVEGEENFRFVGKETLEALLFDLA